jgi:hypothetical protein
LRGNLCDIYIKNVDTVLQSIQLETDEEFANTDKVYEDLKHLHEVFVLSIINYSFGGK